MGTDLRQALDAAISSPSGTGVAVDASGAVAVASMRPTSSPCSPSSDAPRIASGTTGDGVRYLTENFSYVLELTREHLSLALLRLLLGLVIAIPLGTRSGACDGCGARRS